MMRRLRLNVYRAEDMLFIMKKRQWEEEDREFAIEQKRRAKEKRERLVKKNRERRLKKEKEAQALEAEKRAAEEKEDEDLRKGLIQLLQCPLCFVELSPPGKIYQCVDGHLLCSQCRFKDKDCPSCQGRLAGRNMAMERIAVSVFSSTEVEQADENEAWATAPEAEEKEP